MKKLIFIIPSILSLSILLTFVNCDGDEEPTVQEQKTDFLVSKSGGWSAGSGGSTIQVPAMTATDPEDWANFKAVFTSTNCTTSGHPAGSEAVWPSGSYTLDDAVTKITRHDGVLMTITVLTETKLTVSFAVPEGTETTGRLAALDGTYTFTLQ